MVIIDCEQIQDFTQLLPTHSQTMYNAIYQTSGDMAMIVNGGELLADEPIQGMLGYKTQTQAVSHGLTEAGYDIRVAQRARLGAGQRFVLASSMEYFEMPSHLVAVLHDKSTWARCGLSVFNTVIEPGWCGYLTLELVYHGERDLIIPRGSGIGQLLFHQVSEPARYAGKYQDQPPHPVDAITTACYNVQSSNEME